MQPVFRFAPSPNGELHLGHAFSALLDYELCRRAGGRFLLRIENIDRERSRPAFEAQIYHDLRWLGLAWEEPVRRQSAHMDAYAEALAVLDGMGLVYPGFLTRSEIAAATNMPGWPCDPDGAPHYPPGEREGDRAGLERRRAGGESHAIRLDVAAAVARVEPLEWREEGAGGRKVETIGAKPAIWGDFVVARKDMPTSYHLSVVVDDALQGVTHVVRGRDLYHATAAHVLLQGLLRLPTPVYHHHRLITDAAGRKLSKSGRDTSLRALRAAGATPEDIRRMAGLDAALERVPPSPG